MRSFTRLTPPSNLPSLAGAALSALSPLGLCPACLADGGVGTEEEDASADSDITGDLQLSSHLRGDLDKVVMKAMEKDRRRRYETANGFALDIQRYLDDEPVVAVAPSSAYRMRKWVRRNRGLALGSMAIAAAILVGLIASLYQARRAEAGEQAARESELAARKRFYLADMNVAQQALKSGGVDRARKILERQIPNPGEEDLRNWEWRYFWGLAHRELFTVLADDDPDDDKAPDAVFELALSPRGDLMASAARGGTIRVWDLASRKELFQFKIEAGRFGWVDFSPDGRHLAAGGEGWGAVVVQRRSSTMLISKKSRTGSPRVQRTPVKLDSSPTAHFVSAMPMEIFGILI